MYQVKHTFIHTVDQIEADRIRMLRRTQSESYAIAGLSSASTHCEGSGESGEENGVRHKDHGRLSPVSSSMDGSPRAFVEEFMEQNVGGVFARASPAEAVACLPSRQDALHDDPPGLRVQDTCKKDGFSHLAAELLAHACEVSIKQASGAFDINDRLEHAIAELESAAREAKTLAFHLRTARKSSEMVEQHDEKDVGRPPLASSVVMQSDYLRDILLRLAAAQKVVPEVPAAAAQQRVATESDGSTTRTTLMLRDIPNNYTRQMLLALLDREGFPPTVMNFLYYPVDFRLHAGLGYCFINFLEEADVLAFWSHFEGFSEWELPSRKVAHVSWALPLQGYDQCVSRYRNSQVMHHSVPDEFRPLLFKQGERVPFPAPTKTIRNPRYRRMRGSSTTVQ